MMIMLMICYRNRLSTKTNKRDGTPLVRRDDEKVKRWSVSLVVHMSNKTGAYSKLVVVLQGKMAFFAYSTSLHESHES